MQSMPLMWSAVTALIVLNCQRLGRLLQSMPLLYFAVNVIIGLLINKYLDRALAGMDVSSPSEAGG